MRTDAVKALPELTSGLAVRMEPKVGIEPTAYALPRRCSASELLGLMVGGGGFEPPKTFAC